MNKFQSVNELRMSKLNRAWHLKNKMPVNPTLEQRIDWHLRHAANCACREIPDKMKAILKARKIRIPKYEH